MFAHWCLMQRAPSKSHDSLTLSNFGGGVLISKKCRNKKCLPHFPIQIILANSDVRGANLLMRVHFLFTLPVFLSSLLLPLIALCPIQVTCLFVVYSYFGDSVHHKFICLCFFLRTSLSTKSCNPVTLLPDQLTSWLGPRNPPYL